jgi:alginate O-acetyltransferase complex protein AlgI
MVFQSTGFLIFFFIFFLIHWSVSDMLRIRNFLLLSAGIFLYSLWDVRFTLILSGMIALNYFVSGAVAGKGSLRKPVFYMAVLFNLAPLAIFKYYNFFLESLNGLFSFIGLNTNFGTLDLLLPVGISFYTFLSLSYLIDLYKRQIEPEKNFVNYALSISYFPIIMSGPIHRPRIFLDQLKKINKFDYSLAAEGLRQILTGLFLKVVIADNLARHVNFVFGDYESLNGLTIFLGSIYFSFQLYFDFNGYSEMAIGISKLLGFRINRNFRYPYLSRTISDFWKRWHISLTEWFRDYIFLPLSYKISRKIKPGTMLDSDMFVYSVGIFVTWALTGLWHGAGWNFIIWGMIHAVLLAANKGFFKKKKKILKKLGLRKDGKLLIIYESTLTFLLVNFAWIFFRSGTASDALAMIFRIADVSKWGSSGIPLAPLGMIVIALILEYFQRNREFLFEVSYLKPAVRWGIYFAATMIVIYYSGHETAFIYAGF